ncbi:hypothetical protein [Avibacterium paragallinarum]|uniref:Uncharacterized protein n=2 Tax=Avibacterium paragallinarum TaxID=728 RepID=A0A377IBG4_AVIPA|nr:hypothetical protein [Avibacterium paragallinarum]POY46451.1 hypothetical protein C3364_07370 [Avibacterium paragallinarum]RZN53555.1 hypothetical protein EIG78_12350 [Avibacterium paragallinarum]STO72491.1 Uncharacterised protein [Avibacterium paragallinarum]
MLMKFIDEIFGIIGVLIGFLLLVIGVGTAYYYYPMTTCVIGGLGIFTWLVNVLDFSDSQAKKLGSVAAIGLTIIATGFALYYFPKTTIAFLFLIALGFILGRIEKRNTQNPIQSFKNGFHKAFNK